MSSLGSYLKKLRISSGYSLHTAAQKSTLSHGYIRDLEIGTNRNNNTPLIPKPDTLRKLAIAYNANFNLLMTLAGHTTSDETFESIEFIEIDLQLVLYLTVNQDNLIEYHLEAEVIHDTKPLFDYLLLETKLEKYNFIRIQSGLFINLDQIKGVDSSNLKLIFHSEQIEQELTITYNQLNKYKRTIMQSIEKNTRNSAVIQKPTTLIRKVTF
ncbi:helix-turn-helix domain-containing protein [Paenibacillus enshidis]|uniref:Helix-turn-helix domain-containing protein n=1 Tax=Paenibacillus enshidis TaxID=1458439 RepID=A0ABV5AVB7_9BACL